MVSLPGSTVEPGGVLGEIVARKRVEVAARLEGQSLESLRAAAEPTTRSLAAVLAQPGARFVMEMKRTSPSKGASAGHTPAEVARAYSGVADAMSVLTDAPYFGGSFDDLAVARSIFDGPILCKDFTVDVRQVPEARMRGADAVLVMLSVLDDEIAAACLAEAQRFGMGAIVEVHDEAELERALGLGAAIIGINNRDLRTLKTDLAVTERLAPRVPPGTILISESGIARRADVKRLAPLVDAFLVGSSLMAETDIVGAARRLLFGRVKVCGLTRPEDAQVARALGASFGGLIFVKGSPREVDRAHSDLLVAACREVMLPMVGVFRDDSVERVSFLADHFELAAVQLHGDEDRDFIADLRTRLADDCEIWKTIPVDLSGAPLREPSGDRTLFDTQVGSATGGTGVTFDWGRIAGRPDLARGLVAGGLSPRNIAEADQLGAWALDVNSSVEVAPGIKSVEKMRSLFEALRPAVRGKEPGSC